LLAKKGGGVDIYLQLPNNVDQTISFMF